MNHLRIQKINFLKQYLHDQCWYDKVHIKIFLIIIIKTKCDDIWLAMSTFDSRENYVGKNLYGEITLDQLLQLDPGRVGISGKYDLMLPNNTVIVIQ